MKRQLKGRRLDSGERRRARGIVAHDELINADLVRAWLAPVGWLLFFRPSAS